MRSLARLWVIVFTCLRHGLDELVLAAFPQRWLRPMVWLARLGRKRTHAPRGVRLRLGLERLGPIFVKFGQVLSTRPDLVPEDLAQELAKLQDQVTPFDAAQSRSLIEQGLGQPLSQVFAQLDAEPVASASIAQVHFGRLHDGREVAVKVLRPGMQQVIEQDLALLHRLAAWVERHSADGRRLRPREVVAEFDNYLHDELDLVREAANATQLRRNMQDLSLVMVPEIIWEHTRPSVMVMQRMHGVPVAQVQRLREAGVDLKKLARDGVTIFFTQVFRDGFFHADMHPGNIQVSVDAATFGRYVALDFGIIGTLTENDKQYLAHNFLAFFRRDYKRVAELHVESGWVPAGTRVDALEGAIRAVCEPQFARPLKDISLGQVLLRLFQTSRRFNVHVQPQLVLLQKTLLNVEGLGRQLDPDLDLWATAQPFLERWMHQQLGWSGLAERWRRELPHVARWLPEMPRLAHVALSHLASADGGAAAQQTHALIAQLLAQQQRNQTWLRRAVWLAPVAVLAAAVLAMVGVLWALGALH